MSVILNGSTGITTPGLTNTGTETIVNLTTTGNTILGDASTDTLNVGNGGLVKDASGNVGVGVTPSAWGTLKAIQLANGVSLASYTGGAQPIAYLTSGTYYNGTNWIYSLSSSAVGNYHINQGVHQWFTAPSGTAGNAITFTTAMTLDASGNLGLGVTPSAAWVSTSKVLQINGFNSLAGYASNVTRLSTNAVFDASNEKYGATGAAAYYQQGSGAHSWFTAASGTAGNAITWTTAMTLDSSGNLLVGSGASSNTTLNVWLSSTTAYSATNIAGYRGIHVTNDGAGGFSNLVLNAVDATGAANCFTAINATSETSGSRNSALTFMTREHTTGNIVERMRITSAGKIIAGATTSASGSRFCSVSSTSGTDTNTSAILSTSGTRYHWGFQDGASSTERGTITTNGSSTTYATTSDYRLKNTIMPMTGALEKVSQLKPVTYKWNDSDADGQGFIAHELAEVVPDCVVGEKDAVETYKDENGNEQTRPKYQNVDTSFLVATLTAAIQEQQAMIDELKAKVAALEAA
jgi:hypothetical protein